jgi:hypothetical protein
MKWSLRIPRPVLQCPVYKVIRIIPVLKGILFGNFFQILVHRLCVVTFIVSAEFPIEPVLPPVRSAVLCSEIEGFLILIRSVSISCLVMGLVLILGLVPILALDLVLIPIALWV